MSTTTETGLLTIAVMNTKGGVGKTTATVFLAAALHAAGRGVELWDADPQGSATEWMEDAAQEWQERHGEALPVACHAVNRASMARRTTDADVLLIDTAPGDPAALSAAAARADLVIVPTEPSRLDMSRVWATVDALGQDVPAVVLLNRANPRTRLHAEAVQALADEGVPRFDATIPRREAFKHATGTWPSTPRELGPWAEVAAEIEEMTQQ